MVPAARGAATAEGLSPLGAVPTTARSVITTGTCIGRIGMQRWDYTILDCASVDDTWRPCMIAGREISNWNQNLHVTPFIKNLGFAVAQTGRRANGRSQM